MSAILIRKSTPDPAPLGPLHIHHCQNCQFLGRLATADMYVCGTQNYILRFSSDGPDYSSSCDFDDAIYNEIKRSLRGGDDLFYHRMTLLRLLGTSITNLMIL